MLRKTKEGYLQVICNNCNNVLFECKFLNGGTPRFRRIEFHCPKCEEIVGFNYRRLSLSPCYLGKTNKMSRTIKDVLKKFDEKFIRNGDGRWKCRGWDAEMSDKDIKQFLRRELEEIVEIEYQKGFDKGWDYGYRALVQQLKELKEKIDKIIGSKEEE